MALEDIFRALEEQAEKEREDILSAATLQAEAIAADAAEQSTLTCSQCVDSADVAVHQRATRTANAARLEGKKRVAAVKQRAIEDAFEQAAQVLGDVRNSPGYPELFRALLAEALDGVATAEAAPTVLVDPADETLARSALSELGMSAEVSTDLTTSGGLAVVLGEGRIVRRNTFEDRLDKVRADIESDVAEILFS